MLVYLRLSFLLSVVFDCYGSLRSLVLCLMMRILSCIVFDWFRFFALFCFVFDVTLARLLSCVMFDVYLSALCLVFDCYASARYLVLCLIVTLAPLSCAAFDCYVGALCRCCV